MTRWKSAVLVLLTGAVIISEEACSHRRSQALDPKTFAAVYAALSEENEISRIARRDSTEAARAVQHILDSMGVTREQIQTSLRTYNSNPEQWKVILEETNRKLETR